MSILQCLNIVVQLYGMALSEEDGIRQSVFCTGGKSCRYCGRGGAVRRDEWGDCPGESGENRVTHGYGHVFGGGPDGRGEIGQDGTCRETEADTPQGVSASENRLLWIVTSPELP